MTVSSRFLHDAHVGFGNSRLIGLPHGAEDDVEEDGVVVVAAITIEEEEEEEEDLVYQALYWSFFSFRITCCAMHAE